MSMKPNAQPFPVLLNTSDAMLFAADKLDKMCGDLELIAAVGEALLAVPIDAPEGVKAQDDMRTMLKGVVDKDLQIAAMQGAAREIRAAAHETKLVEARAAKNGIAVKGGAA